MQNLKDYVLNNTILFSTNSWNWCSIETSLKFDFLIELEHKIVKEQTLGETSPNQKKETVSKTARNDGNEDFSNLHGQQEKESKKYTNKQKELADRFEILLFVQEFGLTRFF